MPYISNTEQQRREMLQRIGVDDFEQLLQAIPAKLRLHGLNLEQPLTELEITSRFKALASLNKPASEVNSFLGGGVYDHFVPAAVDHIILRPEFLSAYTPYQAEVSQGTLQYIYEYQTVICELTGMEVSNAGMYDGASAAAEAILMAVRKTKLNKAVVAGTVNPAYLQVINAYTEGVGVQIQVAPHKNGRVDINALKNLVDDKTACLLVQTPNFLGNLEDMFELEQLAHSYKKCLFVAAVDPISLAVLNAPSEYNADIVIGEGQAFGNSANYGGPLFGFFACNQKLVRSMPGRIVGGTKDADGKRAYCLTLQAREQHIRREKATSNICSNQSLATLAALVHVCMLGPDGLTEVATNSTAKAHWLAAKIAELPGFGLPFGNEFFKEFAITTPVAPALIIEQLKAKGIYAGIDLTPYGWDNHLLLAVTEKKTRAQMEELLAALAEVK